MGLIGGYPEATAVTSDDRLLGIDGSSTKRFTPDDIADYVGVAAAPTGVIATDFANLQAAVSSGQRLRSGTYNIGTNTLTISGTDGLRLIGAGRERTVINYTGAGTAINIGAGALTRYADISDLMVRLTSASAGAVGITVDNGLRVASRSVAINGTGVNVTGLKFVGGASKSTYYSEWYGLRVTSNGTCIQFTDLCNAHCFYDGVLDGTGIAVSAQPTTNTCDTNRFFGTKFSTSNATMIRLGGGGAQASYFGFYGCRFEVSGSAAITVDIGSRDTNEFIGGSVGGTITFPTLYGIVDIPSSGLGRLASAQVISYEPTEVPATWPATNYAYAARITVPVRRQYRYGLFYVGAQSGNVQFAVCSLSGTSSVNFTRVMNSGVIACPAVGAVRLDLGVTTLTPGEYALVLWADNTTFQTLRANQVLGSTFRRVGRINAGASGLGASGTFSTWDQNTVLSLGLEADV